MIIPLDKIIKDYDLKISGVLHIGAHIGQEYQSYLDCGITNMVFFEPISKNGDELINRVPTTKNIRIFQLALGNMKGYVEMHVDTTNEGQSSSILEPGTHLTLHPQVKFSEHTEIVAINKLDNLISIDRSIYNMINIDVQGYELEVFKGAVKTLPFIDIIYSEVNIEEVYKGCALIGEIDNFLNEFNFKRVLTEFPKKEDGSLFPWGDALYLRK
jgi:FkbM family methyltransferase